MVLKRCAVAHQCAVTQFRFFCFLRICDHFLEREIYKYESRFVVHIIRAVLREHRHRCSLRFWHALWCALDTKRLKTTGVGHKGVGL